MNDFFYVAIVCPVVHYCMGGLKISEDAEVMTEEEPIPGLYATGEVCGGVHGKNRLGGSSLLDCVVFGRVSGRAVTKYLLQNSKNNSFIENMKEIGVTIGNTKISVDSSNKKISITWDDKKEEKKKKKKKKKKLKKKLKKKKLLKKKLRKKFYIRRSFKNIIKKMIVG